MNHAFFPSQLDAAKCRTCKRPIMDHGKHATCEACSKVGPCEIFMTILMCKDCQEKEQAAQQVNTTPEAQQTRVEEHNNRMAQEAVKTYGDYFNARITPIVQVKELYDLNEKPYAEYHEAIKAQIEHFSRVLFEQVITTTEDTTSKLLIELRVEMRTKLKEGDINYIPPVKAPKVRTDKVSKPKNPLEAMANLMIAAEAKRGRIMTLAEAMRKLQGELGMNK